MARRQTNGCAGAGKRRGLAEEFTYRAKAWFKGHLPAEIEERTRTARAVNVLGR